MGHADAVSRWQDVSGHINQVAREAGRDPGEITTIVVTKFHPSSLVRELVAAGVTHIGESRHQEAVAKHAELADVEVTWHFVGQLQSNKARAVAQYASVIHSLDRASVVAKLASLDHTVEGFIEVNLTGDPGRGGVSPDDLEALVEAVVATPAIRLRGLMAVAPQDVSPAAAFDRVVGFRERIVALAPQATALSLGMSGDYAEAIHAGATHLRIGTAITGKRPSAP